MGSDSEQLSKDVKRYVDIIEQKARMTQQGDNLQWYKIADKNGDLVFEKHFQKNWTATLTCCKR